MTSAARKELRSTFSSTTGGVMTDEAGAITGELQIATWLEEGRLAVRIRYADAEDWYTVSGSPREIQPASRASDPDTHRRLHERTLAALTRPVSASGGNDQPVDISNLVIFDGGRAG